MLRTQNADAVGKPNQDAENERKNHGQYQCTNGLIDQIDVRNFQNTRYELRNEVQQPFCQEKCNAKTCQKHERIVDVKAFFKHFGHIRRQFEGSHKRNDDAQNRKNGVDNALTKAFEKAVTDGTNEKNIYVHDCFFYVCG